MKALSEIDTPITLIKNPKSASLMRAYGEDENISPKKRLKLKNVRGSEEWISSTRNKR